MRLLHATTHSSTPFLSTVYQQTPGLASAAMAVATSMALVVAPCVAPSIAHRSTLSVLSVLNGLRLRGKAVRQLPLSNSQGVGQRLGGLAPGSAVCGVRGGVGVGLQKQVPSGEPTRLVQALVVGAVKLMPGSVGPEGGLAALASAMSIESGGLSMEPYGAQCGLLRF